MRRNRALSTLLLAELGVVAVGAFFHLRSRVAILAAFQAEGTPIPPLTALALSPWLLPGALGAAIAASAIALLAPLRRSQRNGLVGAGLCVASGALIFAVVAGFLPIFQPG